MRLLYSLIECYKLFTQFKTIPFQNLRSSLFSNLATVQKLSMSTSNKQKRLESKNMAVGGISNTKVKPQSIDYLVKNKETIKGKIEGGGSSGLKKALKSVQDAELQELDNLLLEWVTLQRKLGKEIHGAIKFVGAHKIQRCTNSVPVSNS